VMTWQVRRVTWVSRLKECGSDAWVGDDVASAIYSSLPLLESAVDLHHGVPVPVRVDRIFRSKLNAFQVQVQRIRKGDGYEGTRSS